MTNLSPINSGSIGRIPAVEVNNEAAEGRKTTRPRRGDDRVEVSDTARFLAKLNDMPEIRSDLVERVRAQISDGKYDTPEKFDLALDAMIDEAL